MIRDLSKFAEADQKSKRIKKLFWWLTQNLIFKSFLIPSPLRVGLLRIFGAEIGNNVLIRRGVRVHLPWNLKVGANCWIGEDVWIINHAEVTVESNVCISQAAIICSSGHDFRTESLSYKHRKIKIHSGAWICLRATVRPGSIIGSNSVVASGEVFSGSLPANSLYTMGLCKPIVELS